VHLAIVAPLLASWALLALLLGLALFAALVVPRWRRTVAAYAEREHRSLLGVALLFALTATLGSLYFSEIVGFVPCLLCWYQRIAMYPLVLVLGVATLTADREAWWYALPLAALGALISIYHVIIQLRPELDVVTCTTEAPCTLRYLAVFGFVSIPVMAGSGFVGIAALMLAVREGGGNTERSASGPGVSAAAAP
jgi:disulfide bond formation protein DsbB